MEQSGPAVEQVLSPVLVQTYKLHIHSIQFYTEDLVIRSEDFPEVQPRDILEISYEEETFSRLLCQDTVYIQKSITAVQLRELGC